MRIDEERNAGTVATRLDRGRVQDGAGQVARELVALRAPASGGAEAIRGLYYALRRGCGGAPLGRLGVASVARGEGRSTLAANLALSASRETGRPVALVDADLRAPGLHRLFGAEGDVGLSDVLANRADLEAALWEHDASGVTLLPGGRPEPEPARRFMHPRFQRLLAQLRHQFDEIVVDLPPLAFADARIVAPHCSGVVIVVRAGRTDAAHVQDALQGLDGVPVLGAVLNAAVEVDAPQLGAARRALPGSDG